jgi:hypothetical protein
VLVLGSRYCFGFRGKGGNESKTRLEFLSSEVATLCPGVKIVTFKVHYSITAHKQKSSPATSHAGTLGERRYSSYSFVTSALDRGEWSASHPSLTLPRGKDHRYPLYRRLGGPQSRSGHRLEEKSFVCAGYRILIARSSSTAHKNTL